jgi:hypothetical protein
MPFGIEVTKAPKAYGTCNPASLFFASSLSSFYLKEAFFRLSRHFDFGKPGPKRA